MFHMLHRWSIRGQQCGRNHTNECICLVSNMTWVTLYRLADNIHYILQKKNIFFSSPYTDIPPRQKSTFSDQHETQVILVFLLTPGISSTVIALISRGTAEQREQRVFLCWNTSASICHRETHDICSLMTHTFILVCDSYRCFDLFEKLESEYPLRT